MCAQLHRPLSLATVDSFLRVAPGQLPITQALSPPIMDYQWLRFSLLPTTSLGRSSLISRNGPRNLVPIPSKGTPTFPLSIYLPWAGQIWVLLPERSDATISHRQANGAVENTPGLMSRGDGNIRHRGTYNQLPVNFGGKRTR